MPPRRQVRFAEAGRRTELDRRQGWAEDDAELQLRRRTSVRRRRRAPAVEGVAEGGGGGGGEEEGVVRTVRVVEPGDVRPAPEAEGDAYPDDISSGSESSVEIGPDPIPAAMRRRVQSESALVLARAQVPRVTEDEACALVVRLSQVPWRAFRLVVEMM